VGKVTQGTKGAIRNDQGAQAVAIGRIASRVSQGPIPGAEAFKRNLKEIERMLKSLLKVVSRFKKGYLKGFSRLSRGFRKAYKRPCNGVLQESSRPSKGL